MREKREKKFLENIEKKERKEREKFLENIERKEREKNLKRKEITK